MPTRLTAKFADAFYLRTVRAITPLPPLTISKILEWADSHHHRTGHWPRVKSDDVPGAPDEKWWNIENALRLGLRGLPGGSSLAQLLAEKRSVRNTQDLPDLSIKQVLKWADAHKQKTGEWPRQNSGDVLGVTGEKWSNIHAALSQGGRGLPGGSSLPQLLAEKRGVRNMGNLTDLSIKQILRWVDSHHHKCGEWPIRESGGVRGVLGETWANINAALIRGGRGLPRTSSLAQLLAEQRGVRTFRPFQA